MSVRQCRRIPLGRSACAALLLAVAPAAQTVAAQAPGGVFAWPWELTIAAVDQAMRETAYHLVQVRRILDRSNLLVNPVWSAIVESKSHLPAANGQDEVYALDFVGIENGQLSSAQWNKRAALHQQQRNFLLHFQSFTISQASQASANYAMVFLGVGTRAQRPVYRVAVFHRSVVRTGWLLELDVATGYPLYRGEYDVAGQLVSEVEVTAFDPSFSGPLGSAQSAVAATNHESALGALQSLGLPDKAAPLPGSLPAGYIGRRYEVVTDLYSGGKRAVLTYTDGIDDLIVQISADARSSLIGGDALAAYREPVGVTQACFVDRQVMVLTIGRADDDVRLLTENLYLQLKR